MGEGVIMSKLEFKNNRANVHVNKHVKEKKTTNPKEPVEVYIRDADVTDVNLIFSSWLKSARNIPIAGRCDNSIYYSEHHKLIERLLKRGNTLVACEPKDPGNVYGYLNYETIEGLFVCHYAYIKQTFRGLGILGTLLDKAGHKLDAAGLYTHQTIAAQKLAAKYTLIYHPYILINYSHGDRAQEEPNTDVKTESAEETVE